MGRLRRNNTKSRHETESQSLHPKDFQWIDGAKLAFSRATIEINGWRYARAMNVSSSKDSDFAGTPRNNGNSCHCLASIYRSLNPRSEIGKRRRRKSPLVSKKRNFLKLRTCVCFSSPLPVGLRVSLTRLRDSRRYSKETFVS